MQRSGSTTMEQRDKRGELLHSLWISWTFAFGFFSWLAFATWDQNEPARWFNRAAVCAWRLYLFFVFSEVWSVGRTLALGTTVLLGVVSVVHAFLGTEGSTCCAWIWQMRETSSVSVTSGDGDGFFHSLLWISWTFFFGLMTG